MHKTLLILITIIGLYGVSYAVPNLQLFIDGAANDWYAITDVPAENVFDSHAVTVNRYERGVIFSMSLNYKDNLHAIETAVANVPIAIESWIYERAATDFNQAEQSFNDLSRQKIYPTWFSELHHGLHDLTGLVGYTHSALQGRSGNQAFDGALATSFGQDKGFHLDAEGIYSSINVNSTSPDANGGGGNMIANSRAAFPVSDVPEPGTLALLASGLFGMGAYIKRKKS